MKKYIVPEIEIEEVSSEDIMSNSYEMKAGSIEGVEEYKGGPNFISGVGNIT